MKINKSYLRFKTNTVKKDHDREIEKEMRESIEKDSREGVEKTAINMLSQKLSDNLICQVTGLSKDELLKLKNKL